MYIYIYMCIFMYVSVCVCVCLRVNMVLYFFIRSLRISDIWEWPLIRTQSIANYCKCVLLTIETATQRTATYGNALQQTATHCDTLQHATTHSNALHIGPQTPHPLIRRRV